jgi:hypothetical protein
MIRFDTFRFDYDTKNVIIFSRAVVVLLVCRACLQRFAAWRSGGFLAQKFKRRTALEPTTKLSYEALHPPLRQTAVMCCASLSIVKVFSDEGTPL